METSIGGMLVMGVLLAMIILLARTFIVSNQLMGAALKDAADLSGDRTRTQIGISDTTSTGAVLELDLSNAGRTSVAEHDEMDLILKYQATATAATVITRLAYVAGSPSANDEWTNSTTSPDILQPGIWDPGETLTVDARLSILPASGIGTVHVSTPNGVVAKGTFTVP